MTEKSTFPYNNWYLNFTEEQRPIVDNWRINIIKFSNTPCPTNIISWNGSQFPGRQGVVWGLGECLITIDQFKQYVLNQETITEDLSYLIDFINNKQIK